MLFLFLFAGAGSHYAAAQCSFSKKKMEKIENKYFDLDDNPEAIKYLTEEINKTPDCFWLYFHRGCSYLDIKDYKAAFADFRKAISSGPLTVDPMWNWYKENFLTENGRIEEQLDSAGSRDFRKENYQLSMEAYRFALELHKTKDKKYREYLLNIGDCQLRLQNYEEASLTFLEAFQTETDNPYGAHKAVKFILSQPKILHREKFYLVSSRLNIALNNFQDAVADFNEAKKIDPDLPGLQQLKDEIEIKLAESKKKEEALAEKVKREKSAEMMHIKATNPQLFETLRKAIEENDPDAKVRLFILAKFSYCRRCSYDMPSINKAGLYYSVDRPLITIGSYNDEPVAMFTRQITGAVRWYGSPEIDEDGKQKSMSDSIFWGKFGSSYNIEFSGTNITLTPTEIVIGGDKLETLEPFLTELYLKIKSYDVDCNCDANAFFRKAIPWSTEFTKMTKITIDEVKWDGSITITAHSALNGEQFEFDGKVPIK